MTVWVPSCVLPEPFEHNLALGLAAFQQRMGDGQAVTVPGVRNTFHYKIQ